MPHTQYAADAAIRDVGTGLPVPDVARCHACGAGYPPGASCRNCTTCDRCHTTVPVADTVDTVRGSTICPDCRATFYWQCASCDGFNRLGNDCGNDCDADADDDEHDDRDDGPGDFGGLVHDYSYKPYPVFHGTGPLFLGAEIEIETPDYRDIECAELADSWLGNLGYLKLDASIGNGFEIVTHPMSYPWAIDHFPWKMLTQLDNLGCAATERTGIHVHLSRAGFTSIAHTYRWMKFIHRNEPQVTTVARRCSEEWAAFTAHDRKAVKDYAKGVLGQQRYRAINTCNTDTFELRIFASSLDPQEVQAALGFAAASVEYTRNLTIGKIAKDGGWTWPGFVTWLSDQSAYAPLRSQMEALQCVC